VGYIGFDLETAEIVNDEKDESGGIGITCAAIFTGTAKQVFAPSRALKGTSYPARMSPSDCQNLARALIAYQDAGWPIVTFNGLKFDFQVLAAECQNREWFEKVVDLALGHIDILLAFYCYKGFLKKLTSFTEAMGIGTKSEGMDGLKAIDYWESGDLEQQKQVLEYVKQDATITWHLHSRALGNNRLSWINSKGRISKWYLPEGLVPDVETALRNPNPDMSWWQGYEPIPREDFYGWTNRYLVS
jgi:hypothetical protein